MMKNSRIKFGSMLVVLLTSVFFCAPVIAATVTLTRDGQGGSNIAAYLYRPFDEFGDPAIFELTARSMVDLNEPDNPYATSFDVGPGTVYINQDGAGVKNNAGEGSPGISGGGPEQNEELIFTFDNPISINNIILGLNKIGHVEGEYPESMGFQDDEPILFLSSAATPGVFDYVVYEQEIALIFDEIATHMGTVDFGLLNHLIPDGLIIDCFKLRETDGHIAANSINAVPEPASICALGMGALFLLRKRRNRK